MLHVGERHFRNGVAINQAFPVGTADDCSARRAAEDLLNSMITSSNDDAHTEGNRVQLRTLTNLPLLVRLGLVVCWRDLVVLEGALSTPSLFQPDLDLAIRSNNKKKANDPRNELKIAPQYQIVENDVRCDGVSDWCIEKTLQMNETSCAEVQDPSGSGTMYQTETTAEPSFPEKKEKFSNEPCSKAQPGQ